jgi:hypothetical protein
MTKAPLLHTLSLFGFGAAGIAVMTAAFYGWGRLTRHLAGLPDGTWPVSVALGLAVSIFFGGVLNLCRLAYPAILAAIAVAGLALAAMAARRGGVFRWPVSYYALAWGVVVAALTGLMIATQLAPALYNSYDDFQYYFPHAVRMVETGTLYGSPLNALGGESLGGQTFLQGFVVGFFPLKFINAADAVFCFFLCMALAGSPAFGRPALWPAAIVGTLAVFIINPQFVNVASLYSTVLLASALTILSVDPRERGNDVPAGWRQAAIPALFYAGAVALKNTGLVFFGLQFVIFTTASCWAATDRRACLLHAGRIAVLSAVFLAPWLLLYAPYYLVGLTDPIGAPSLPVPRIQDVLETRDLQTLFSPVRNFHGASLLACTSLALGLCMCALFAARRARCDPVNSAMLVALASAAAAATASYFFWVFFGPYLQELESSVRFSIPVLIGVCAVALPLWAVVRARRDFALYATVLVVLFVLFTAPMRERVGSLLHQGTQVAYIQHWKPELIKSNIEFTQNAFEGPLRAHMQALQAKIQPGEAFLAWTAAPFLLDYRRNQIVDMNMAGFSQLWGRIPRLRYILWQYRGMFTDAGLHQMLAAYGRRMGTMSARAIDVTRYMQSIPPSKIVGEQDYIVLIRVDDEIPPPPN